MEKGGGYPRLQFHLGFLSQEVTILFIYRKRVCLADPSEGCPFFHDEWAALYLPFVHKKRRQRKLE